MLMDLGADYYNTSGVIRLTLTDLILTRNHIKINPASVRALNHTLRTKDIVRIYEALKDFLDLGLLEFMRCLLAPACKYLIRMVMMMLGIMGEYIGRIFMCINSAPQFVVKKVYEKTENGAGEEEGAECRKD